MRRDALSLLEVFVALSVFGGGLAATAYGLAAAHRAGLNGHFRTSALLRAKSLHALLERDAVARSRGDWNRCTDDPGLLWRVEESPAEVPGWVLRTVVIRRQVNAVPMTFALSRIAPVAAKDSTGGVFAARDASRSDRFARDLSAGASR
jgi:hypothetical protein